MAISQWDAERAAQSADDLGKLLCDAVNGGAAVGFLPPLDRDHAWAYWVEVSRSIAAGEVQLLVLERGDELIGAVQLHEAQRPNATHRAEVTKLMVRSLYRRQGHGRQLLLAVQALARARGRTTLVMDTRAGDRSERLYQALGWVKSGEVPNHARSADGSLHTTSFYHLILGTEPG
jgi:acetyltransferase